MRIKICISAIAISALIGVFFFWKSSFQSAVSVSVQEEKNIIADIQSVQSEQVVKEKENTPVVTKAPGVIEKKIIQNVPFTSQAPTGNWNDPVFQNACEEATLLMADKWLQGREFGTAREREIEIRRMTKEEESYFPKDSYDLSATDILVLAQKYYPEMRISLVENVTTDDMKKALSEGSIVIIPTNGRTLRNPNFTAPGPLYHTLLIRGFDPVTDEFITNDPGTRMGALYRYAADTVFHAMHNNETGHHGKIFPDEKVMLVIRKNPSLGSPTSK